MDDRQAQGDHVRLGAHPRAFPVDGIGGFSKFLVEEAKVAVSPGLGFGEYGDDFVRFALVENEMRTKQAIRGLRRALQKTVSPRKRATAG